MARDGLVTRERTPENRRVQRVALTDEGERRFLALRAAAVRFDARIRAGLDDDDVARLRELLAAIEANAGG